MYEENSPTRQLPHPLPPFSSLSPSASCAWDLRLPLAGQDSQPQGREQAPGLHTYLPVVELHAVPFRSSGKRKASLLSCDPSTRQGGLVPGGEPQGWCKGARSLRGKITSLWFPGCPALPLLPPQKAWKRLPRCRDDTQEGASSQSLEPVR